MKFLYLTGLAVLISASAVAERAQAPADFDRHGPQSTITLSVAVLNCATNVGAGAFSARSWSWGASNDTSSGSSGSGSGAGKATTSSLMIKKGFDACSPSLLGAVTSGKHFATLNLSQQDSNGNVVATVQLTEVFVSSWSVGSTTKESTPDEAVAFVFRKVCLANAGSNTVCFDAATNKTT
jgi:type VI protein secretion system component Hcp